MEQPPEAPATGAGVGLDMGRGTGAGAGVGAGDGLGAGPGSAAPSAVTAITTGARWAPSLRHCNKASCCPPPGAVAVMRVVQRVPGNNTWPAVQLPALNAKAAAPGPVMAAAPSVRAVTPAFIRATSAATA